jgi:nucleotide-binding universal stress UspA family protein
MMNIERILWPASFPLHSDEALRYAVSVASVYHAKLFLCHCAAAPVLVAPEANGAGVNRLRQALGEALARYLGNGNYRNWETIVAESGNDTGEEIVRSAGERGVDLIVMRSRRSRIAALLGSTAEHVSRRASCPVLIVHPQEPDSEGKSTWKVGFDRILVSHDFSGGSELALSYALSIAHKFKAELHLLHVLPEPDEEAREGAWTEEVLESAYYRAAQRLLTSVPAEINKQLSVIHAVRWGKPYREVLAYAREHEMDLVSMGALGKDFGSEALFGSNVDRVLRQAACPVLVARPLRSAVPELIDLSIAKPDIEKSLASRQ